MQNGQVSTLQAMYNIVASVYLSMSSSIPLGQLAFNYIYVSYLKSMFEKIRTVYIYFFYVFKTVLNSIKLKIYNTAF